MRKESKKIAVVALIVLVAAGVFFRVRRPGSAPSGQPALVELSPGGASQFDHTFDSDAGLTRVVLLLSPT